MKKILLFLLVCTFAAPVAVSADAYGGPYCFETPFSSENDPDTSNIRGTCKEIDIFTVVSLDSTLQKDYFLGTHEPIPYECEIGCAKSTMYSEVLFLTSSTTLKNKVATIEGQPIHYALFDKTFFVPLFTELFKKSGLPFSEVTMPTVSINVLKQSELDEIEKVDRSLEWIVPDDMRFDSVRFDADSRYMGRPTPHKLYTLNYLEYGKYILAPKGLLAETQYADFESSGNLLNDKELQITQDGDYRRPHATVSIVSPLKSVTNHWIYTKKNGKLVLSWQKSEYGLDNGQVKTVTSADKNVSAALLFSNVTQAPTIAPLPVAVVPPIATATTANTETAQIVEPAPEPKKGFFARIWDTILAWFQ